MLKVEGETIPGSCKLSAVTSHASLAAERSFTELRSEMMSLLAGELVQKTEL